MTVNGWPVATHMCYPSLSVFPLLGESVHISGLSDGPPQGVTTLRDGEGEVSLFWDHYEILTDHSKLNDPQFYLFSELMTYFFRCIAVPEIILDVTSFQTI